MPITKEERARRWKEYASKNREALREKGRIRYHSNIEKSRKRNAERMRLSNKAKRQAKLADPDYKEVLAQREKHKALFPERKNKWIQSSKKKRKARAEQNKGDKLPPHQRKYRRGFIREDGMVFWRYQWDQIEQEKWVTKEHYKNKAPIERERALKRAASNPTKANRATVNRWMKWKHKNDPLFALKRRCRSRLQSAIRLKGWKKPCKTSEMLGCDWETLKLHIEHQFLPKMNWENRELWHIDHFHPLDDAKSIEDVVRLSHYTNLRPMWAKDNHKKWKHLPSNGLQIPLLIQ